MRIVYFIFILLSIGFLSNSPLHPSGNTGAPGDSFCGGCHSGSGGALDGEISITGFPATIMPNTTYTVTVTTTNPAINATRAGFQILVLDSGDNNIGAFSNNPSDTQIRMQSGRFYLGHKPAKFFSGAASVSWTTDWTSPATGSGAVTIYGASVIANGSGGNSGDRSVMTNEVGTFMGGGGAPLAISVVEDSPTSCSDSDDGKASAIATGGTPPYEYDWDNGETTKQAINLSPGTHDVTVTDAVNSAITDQVFINSPPPVIGTIISQGDAICNGENSGFADLSASGGTPNYTYSWSDGGSGPNRNDLTAGSYIVTVSDGNLCETTINLFISEPTVITASETISHVSCNDGNNGTINITPGGGTGGGFSYQWSNGSSDQNQFNLTAGTYTLNLFDSNNCTESFQFTINEPLPLEIVIDNTMDASCNGSMDGVASLSGSGGTSPYTFTWSDGGTGADRNDLASGDYTINILDAKQCGSTTTLTINEPDAIVVDSIDAKPASCPGVNDGSLTIAADGGVGNFTYLWSNGDIEATAMNLAAGNHTVIVKDMNNCTMEKSYTLGALSAASLATSSIDSVSCNGGSNGAATVMISNGMGYDINWSNNSTGNTISGVTAGTYTAQASNSAGCISNTVSIIITEPMPIAIAMENTTDPLCTGENNGSVSISGIGGTGNLTYLWAGGEQTSTITDLTSGQYSVIITDENSCILKDTFEVIDPMLLHVDSFKIMDNLCNGNEEGIIDIFASGGTGNLMYSWTNGDSTNMLDQLPAGSYMLIITDANGCKDSTNYIITEPSIIVANQQIKDETEQGKNDGSIKLNPTGGTPGYTFLWSNGDMTDSIGGLTPGQYSVDITDKNGCTTTESFNVSSGDCSLEVTFTIVDVNCFGGNDGQIVLNATGVNGNSKVTITPNAPLDSLSAGQYDITVLDDANCSITLEDIIINEPLVLTITIDEVKNSDNSNNGSIKTTITGGTPGYAYEWVDIDGNIVGTDQDLIDVGPGIYILNIIDANSCIISSVPTEILLQTSTFDLDSNISIAPNPVSDLLYINHTQIINKINLYTLNGRLVKKSTSLATKMRISTDQFDQGIYILEVYTNGSKSRHKIVIL